MSALVWKDKKVQMFPHTLPSSAIGWKNIQVPSPKLTPLAAIVETVL